LAVPQVYLSASRAGSRFSLCALGIWEEREPLRTAQWKVIVIGVALSAATATSAFAQSPAQDSPFWIELGCQEVSAQGNSVTPFPQAQAHFGALRAYVREGDLEVLNLNVAYGDGAPQSIPVKQVLARGDRTPDLLVQDGQRAVKQVDLTYGPVQGSPSEHARVCVQGLALKPATATYNDGDGWGWWDWWGWWNWWNWNRDHHDWDNDHHDWDNDHHDGDNDHHDGDNRYEDE
jgi:hypothetical protein